MDFAFGGFSIGRFFGIRVIISWMFVLYAGFNILHSDNGVDTALFLLTLFGSVLLHEFGHCFACRSVKGQADHIVLWPLGGLAFVRPPPRPGPSLWTAAGGPLVNVILIPLATFVLAVIAPSLRGTNINTQHAVALLGLYGFFVNATLLFFNVLPIYPLDGGRMLQSLLWLFIGYPSSLRVTGMIGTVGGLSLAAMGLGVTSISMPYYLPGPGWREFPICVQGHQDWVLIVIGVWAAMQSFAIYRHSQQIETWRKR